MSSFTVVNIVALVFGLLILPGGNIQIASAAPDSAATTALDANSFVTIINVQTFSMYVIINLIFLLNFNQFCSTAL